MTSYDFRPLRQFLRYQFQFLGSFWTTLPTQKSDIVNVRSLNAKKKKLHDHTQNVRRRICYVRNFIFYEKSKGYFESTFECKTYFRKFLKYVLTFKRAFMKRLEAFSFAK